MEKMAVSVYYKYRPIIQCCANVYRLKYVVNVSVLPLPTTSVHSSVGVSEILHLTQFLKKLKNLIKNRDGFYVVMPWFEKFF